MAWPQHTWCLIISSIPIAFFILLSEAFLFQQSVGAVYQNPEEIPAITKYSRKRRSDTVSINTTDGDDFSSDNDDFSYYPADAFDLSSNKITGIEEFCRIEHFKVLRYTFRSLTRLTLSYNCLESLPQSIWRCLENLTVVELNSNCLSSLPYQIFTDCRNLVSLDASSNKVRFRSRQFWDAPIWNVETKFPMHLVARALNFYIPRSVWLSSCVFFWVPLFDCQISETICSVTICKAWTKKFYIEKLA